MGGVAQGIGGAIYEEIIYDKNGQLLTGTYMDYLIPTASEIPEITSFIWNLLVQEIHLV